MWKILAGESNIRSVWRIHADGKIVTWRNLIAVSRTCGVLQVCSRVRGLFLPLYRQIPAWKWHPQGLESRTKLGNFKISRLWHSWADFNSEVCIICSKHSTPHPSSVEMLEEVCEWCVVPLGNTPAIHPLFCLFKCPSQVTLCIRQTRRPRRCQLCLRSSNTVCQGYHAGVAKLGQCKWHVVNDHWIKAATAKAEHKPRNIIFWWACHRAASQRTQIVTRRLLHRTGRSCKCRTPIQQSQKVSDFTAEENSWKLRADTKAKISYEKLPIKIYLCILRRAVGSKKFVTCSIRI